MSNQDGMDETDADDGEVAALWQEIISRESAPFFPEVSCLTSHPSTMDAARDRIRAAREKGEPILPMAVVALEQTEGRGTRGSTWKSPRGGMWVTFVVPDAPAAGESMSGCSLAVGVIVAQLLMLHGVSVRLKWPNDVMSEEGKKLGGILLERVAGDVLLIGIGINCRNEPPAPGMTSLQREVASPDLVPPVPLLIGRLARPLRDGLDQFFREGFAAFGHRWETLSFSQGVGRVVIEDRFTGERREVVYEGVDGRGRLRVHGKRGTETLDSSRARLISPACRVE